MDKHLKSLAPRHFTTKFLKLDAEVSIEGRAACMYCTPKKLKFICAIFFLVECSFLCYQAWNQDIAMCHTIQVILVSILFLNFQIINFSISKWESWIIPFIYN